jgi:hypothetical protein
VPPGAAAAVEDADGDVLPPDGLDELLPAARGDPHREQGCRSGHGDPR